MKYSFTVHQRRTRTSASSTHVAKKNYYVGQRIERLLHQTENNILFKNRYRHQSTPFPSNCLLFHQSTKILEQVPQLHGLSNNVKQPCMKIYIFHNHRLFLYLLLCKTVCSTNVHHPNGSFAPKRTTDCAEQRSRRD